MMRNARVRKPDPREGKPGWRKPEPTDIVEVDPAHDKVVPAWEDRFVPVDRFDEELKRRDLEAMSQDPYNFPKK